MRARLLERDGQIELLLSNGKVRKLNQIEAKNFLLTFTDEKHYEGEDSWDFDVCMDDYDGETIAVVDDQGKLIVYSQPHFVTILSTKYLTGLEYAKLHGKQVTLILRFCREGRISGAVKIGRDWMIPENAPYPKDTRGRKKVYLE